jgi:hypothetical protein
VIQAKHFSLDENFGVCHIAEFLQRGSRLKTSCQDACEVLKGGEVIEKFLILYIRHVYLLDYLTGAADLLTSKTALRKDFHVVCIPGFAEALR